VCVFRQLFHSGVGCLLLSVEEACVIGTVGSRFQQFAGTGQQDCTEFLEHLIEGLVPDMCRNPKRHDDPRPGLVLWAHVGLRFLCAQTFHFGFFFRLYFLLVHTSLR
jgi:hypothetical protein